MTEQTLRDLNRQAGSVPLPADAEAALAAVLLDGDEASREAGLDQLASLPAGPALARVLASMAPDARMLEADIARLRRSRRRAWPALVAMAAGIGAAAVLVVGLREAPVEPVQTAAQPEQQKILVASFEGEAPSVPAASDGQIFNGGFDS